jgi:hypothetical protein
MAKKNKVPKTIAGVKLPKALRRGLRDLAASQNGRLALTEALAAAGAALAATAIAKPAPETPEAAVKLTPKARAAANKLRSQATKARAATVAALEEATRSFTRALQSRQAIETAVQTPPPPSTH